VRRPERHGLGDGRAGQFGEISFAHKNKAGRPEPGREEGVVLFAPVKVAQEAHPFIVGVAGRVAQKVFEQQGNAAEWPSGQGRGGRLCPRPVE